jgi:translation initiation factor IF-2
VVTFLGHVDHGKTSLIDFIREGNVAAGEAGGITQHIGAYTIKKNDQEITFLDTPGHAAFTKMRARGASMTDIAVIVIAADAGLMPQTREAIMHARNADVAMIVAINKMDLSTANIDRVKQQLQQDDLTPEDWGGETIVVPVSAKTGDGISDLLEMILLQAEIMELKTVATGPARGAAIEAQLEKGRGPTATLLVTSGLLKVGNTIVCGAEYGKVKSLIDFRGKNVKSAGPSHAVKVMGLSGVPAAGAEFEVYATEREAKVIAGQRSEEIRLNSLGGGAGASSGPGGSALEPKKMSLDDLFNAAGQVDILELPIVLKADVQGSLEALTQSLAEIKSEKIQLKYVLTGVGSITGNDILRAGTSNAIVIGFNVSKENNASAIAKENGIEIRLYDIIYELIDEVRAAMTGLLPPETRDKISGSAEIRQIFKLNNAGNVAGCMVVSGKIRANARARVMRNRDIIYKGAVSTLKRFQDDAKEVRDGQECGIRLENFSEFEKGDVVETYETEILDAEL